MPSRVVVFDTSCLLCSRFVQVLLKANNGSLRFTGFESEFSMKVLSDDLRLNPQTVVLYDNGRLLVKSEAVLTILKHTNWRYRWLRILQIIPTIFLDMIYDWIARNRFAWFGQSSECFVPGDNDEAKFLA